MKEKKIYSIPEIEIVEIEVSDVVTTSDPTIDFGDIFGDSEGTL